MDGIGYQIHIVQTYNGEPIEGRETGFEVEWDRSSHYGNCGLADIESAIDELHDLAVKERAALLEQQRLELAAYRARTLFGVPREELNDFGIAHTTESPDSPKSARFMVEIDGIEYDVEMKLANEIEEEEI